MIKNNLYLVAFLFALAISSLVASPVYAQSGLYGNEWINYDRTHYKIKVTEEGLYRIPYSVLSNLSGLNMQNTNGGDLIIFRDGEVVPYFASRIGIMNQGDYIEFYAYGNTGHNDVNLFPDPDGHLHPHYSLFSDTATYFLRVKTATENNRLIQSVSNNLTNLPPKESYFMHVERGVYTTNHFTRGEYSTVFGGQRMYASTFNNGEGFVDTLFNMAIKNKTINTPYISNQVSTAKISYSAVSTSNTNHHFIFRFNGSTLKDVNFNGHRLHKDTFAIPASLLQNQNTFQFQAGSANNVSRNNIAYCEIEYARNFNFGGDSIFLFHLQAASGERYLEITNFEHANTTPILYDLTNGYRLTGQGGSSTQEFKLPAGSGAAQERKLFLTNQYSTIVRTITNLTEVNFTPINELINQGDFVIISHPHFFNDGQGNNFVEEYRAYRSSMQGGNYTAKVYNIYELYDQFAYGTYRNPLAIRNFIRFAKDNWSVQPENVFLIGKGRQYNSVRRGSGTSNNTFFVPTFGAPASDQLLAATNQSDVPLVGIGRLAVVNPNEIKTYLSKVKEFEEHQRLAGDPYQTIENKLWMKEILHLGGGGSNTEQSFISTYLGNYKSIVEDTLFGGNVLSFFKTSSAPIQIGQSQKLHDRINDGVSLLTFYGHSTTNSFDISLDAPENYTNFGKYPMILSLGCFSGNIFTQNKGISERFVLIPDRGAIAFLSTIGQSAMSGLNTYAFNFYKNFSTHTYGNTLGQIIRNSIEDISQSSSTNISRLIYMEMTLHGDPALRLNPHDKPDYVLEPQMVAFEPSYVTLSTDSFDIQVIGTNIGRAVNDSIILRASREFPDGSSWNYDKKIHAPYYQDTFMLRIPVGSASALGMNVFRIKIDADDEIDEISESNNEIVYQLMVFSEDVYPAYPYEFAIVPYQGVTLKATTANPFAPVTDYIIEIDSTELFNSPLKQSTTINQSGGVLKWTPGLIYMDSVVYYWRVGIKAASGEEQTYRYSSFIYLDGSYPGWNQSHYFQYKKDSYANMYIDTDRKFKYIDDVKEVRVVNGTLSSGLIYEDIAYYLNGSRMQYWNCRGNGFTSGISIAVFDSITGEPMTSHLSDVNLSASPPINTVWGNIHCKNRDFYAFDFMLDEPYWNQRVIDFLSAVPNGSYIMIQSIGSVNYSDINQDLRNLISGLGSNYINVLVNQNSNLPWVFFGKKGHPVSVQEHMGQNSASVLDLVFNFEVNWYAGRMNSTVIGPAFDWKALYWDHVGDNYDTTYVNIFGIQNNGTEIKLYEEIEDGYFDLSVIDANQYPKIRLQMYSRNDTNRIPGQLSYWRILYDKVPEAALNPHAYFEYDGDTIQLGQKMRLKVAIESLTDIHMDSLLIKYSVTDATNQTEHFYIREDSLKGLDTMIASFDLETNNTRFRGLNQLVIEVNPYNDQPEQYHFNNIGMLNFRAIGDNMNPLLDVTFDGVHIMDGDMVAAEPEIRIRLKDENPFLLLNDTTIFNVFLEYPDGHLRKVNFSDPHITFIPADGNGSNSAEVVMREKFQQDGIYRLKVQAQDRSNNASGYYGNPDDGMDYKVNFEIMNKNMISNVVNYPNPFTTSTRFVFTVTGNKPPDFMKIQIMTVTGKIVREIMMDELGPIRIGNNISDFAWNGTDQFGDRLANGLYLYRVVASIDGESIDRLETSADRFFHSGFGKMYLAR